MIVRIFVIESISIDDLLVTGMLLVLDVVVAVRENINSSLGYCIFSRMSLHVIVIVERLVNIATIHEIHIHHLQSV